MVYYFHFCSSFLTFSLMQQIIIIRKMVDNFTVDNKENACVKLSTIVVIVIVFLLLLPMKRCATATICFVSDITAFQSFRFPLYTLQCQNSIFTFTHSAGFRKVFREDKCFNLDRGRKQREKRSRIQLAQCGLVHVFFKKC